MVKKKQLRDFLNDRMNTQFDEILEIRNKIKEEEVARLLINDKRPIEWWKNIYSKAKYASNAAMDIRNDFSMWSGPVRMLSDVTSLMTFDTFMDGVKDSVSVSDLGNATISKAYNEYDLKREQIRNEYNKLQGVIDSSTAKQAYEYLKEVGFDLSEVVDEPKHELVAVKPNLEVLGLPETKE